MKIQIIFTAVMVLLSQRAVGKEDPELEKHRPYESFVELTGGEFMMGINDHNGVNYEYPHRKASVKPFR